MRDIYFDSDTAYLLRTAAVGKKVKVRGATVTVLPTQLSQNHRTPCCHCWFQGWLYNAWEKCPYWRSCCAHTRPDGVSVKFVRKANFTNL